MNKVTIDEEINGAKRWVKESQKRFHKNLTNNVWKNDPETVLNSLQETFKYYVELLDKILKCVPEEKEGAEDLRKDDLIRGQIAGWNGCVKSFHNNLGK
jgi:ABC-type Fe3+-citrate transport system substrate-binding protein